MSTSKGSPCQQGTSVRSPPVIIAPPELSLSVDAFVGIEHSPQEGDGRSLYRAHIIIHECCAENRGGVQYNVAKLRTTVKA